MSDVIRQLVRGVLLGLVMLGSASCSLSRADHATAVAPPSKKIYGHVSHPCLTIKPADLARAKQNLARYAWAREYRDSLSRQAAYCGQHFTPDVIDHMIDSTTPISSNFTPCPACRDLHKPYQPHGHWSWTAERPDEIKCDVCGTVFPNNNYPESIEVHTKWGTPQTFTFAGGEPFEVFGYKTGRPSFTGLIRARKIEHMTRVANLLAEAYLLTSDARYARTCRAILARFAEVYPHYLVHVGYGEIADMDPRIAAANIKSLPADESVYPPNKPDRQLHTGFWTAGRATGTGMEGRLASDLAEAYDSTCDATDESGNAIYSGADRIKIERDLLMESTILFTADKQINNKSVSNRSAAAMVGMVVGDPSLVRFGLDGFHRTIDQWFLPDGSTPESNSYAMMALGGVNDFALAADGYSDPNGYRDHSGKRIDHVDLFHGTAYERAWSALVNGLNGDLTMPEFADTRLHRKIDTGYIEILVEKYPDRPQYLALLHEMCGPDLTKGITPSVALYHREPGLESRPSIPFALPDICLPNLRIGHMRTGPDGRESLLLLSASHWGTHHHLDSLNLSYWKDGHELLSDLGYLWDNPNKSMTTRTLAHNTVIVDESDQHSADRGGEVELFDSSPHVKVMRASSNAYEQAKTYRRTSAIIDHGDGRNYVVDFFDVEGGRTRDYIFHGPNNKFTAATSPADVQLYDFKNVRELSGPKIEWTIDDKTGFTAWALPQPDEKAFLGDGWGQRDPYNVDFGAMLPYIVRRAGSPGPARFVSIFEAHPAGNPFVKSAKRSTHGDGTTVVEVETLDGRDTIVCNRGFSVTSTEWTFTHDQ